MKLTIDNFKKIVPSDDQSLISTLLSDLSELNTELDKDNQQHRKLYINYIDEHTEYSPERTDPCPDYFGMYQLLFEENPGESVGDVMTINELDGALCVLINFVEFK